MVTFQQWTIDSRKTGRVGAAHPITTPLHTAPILHLV